MVKMFDGLFIASLIGSAVQLIKEAFEPEIPAENWANKKLYYEDLANGVSAEQRLKNVRNGKYKIPKVQDTNKYPEPHRDDVTGKIIIDNFELWSDDVYKYDAAQVTKWVEQGKYNLTPEEIRKRKEELDKKFERLYELVSK